MMVHVFNPSTQEAVAGATGNKDVSYHTQLARDFIML